MGLVAPSQPWNGKKKKMGGVVFTKKAIYSSRTMFRSGFVTIRHIIYHIYLRVHSVPLQPQSTDSFKLFALSLY